MRYCNMPKEMPEKEPSQWLAVMLDHNLEAEALNIYPGFAVVVCKVPPRRYLPSKDAPAARETHYSACNDYFLWEVFTC